jgi:hypothetical protein
MMKRAEISASISDDNLMSNADLPELSQLSAADNNDAEIAEIVDVINNDSSLLPSGIMEGYINGGIITHSLPNPDNRNKNKLAKRQKLDVVLPKTNHNLIVDRLVGTLHMPLQTPKMGRDRKDTRTTCGICGAKTTIKCSHCAVGMCIADRDGRNCWREFHTRDVLEYKQQPKTERKDRSRQIGQIGLSMSSNDAAIMRNNQLQQELHLLASQQSNMSSDSGGLV